MTVLTMCEADGIAAHTVGGEVAGAPIAGAEVAEAHRDLWYGGEGMISGMLLVEDPIGTPERPIRRRLILVDRRSDLEVQQTISDPDIGAWQFANLRKDVPFRVEADDYTAAYNAVVADWLYAE